MNEPKIGKPDFYIPQEECAVESHSIACEVIHYEDANEQRNNLKNFNAIFCQAQ